MTSVPEAACKATIVALELTRPNHALAWPAINVPFLYLRSASYLHISTSL